MVLLRIPAAFAALTICLVCLSACGGENDSASTSPEEAQQEAQAQEEAATKAQNARVLKEYREGASPKPTEEEVEAKKTATNFYKALEEDEAKDNPNRTTIDSGSFCDLMSEEAKAQTIEYAKAASGTRQEWDCESAVELLVLRSKRTGGFKSIDDAEVIGINAQGDRAIATVRVGDGLATTIPMVREDGRWKLAASPVAQGEK